MHESATQRLQADLDGDRSLRAFALIDGALLLKSPPHVQSTFPPNRATSLLAGADADAITVGPLLYELSPQEIRTECPDLLLNRVDGWLIGSLLVAKCESDALAPRLADLVDVQLADLNVMLMRFFDPRILPFWLKILPAMYRNHLGELVQAWVYWDSGLALQTFSFSRTATSRPLVQLPMHLSQHQEDHLIESCHPHMLIERFRRENSRLIEKIPPELRYDFFQNQLEQCRGYHIGRAMDMELYCRLAMEFGPHFDKSPIMTPLLELAQQGEELHAAVSTLKPDDWQALRGYAPH